MTATTVDHGPSSTTGDHEPTVNARRRPRRTRLAVAGNVAARVGALAALAGATVLVARVGGPDLVGAFTLFRVLPGLFGVLAACGLPGAIPYFLASRADDLSLRPTLLVITVLGATAGTLAWLIMSPLLYRLFFTSLGMAEVLLVGTTVFFQLFVAAGKACLQGRADLAGANAAIVAEEVAFLPLYLVTLAMGHGALPLIVALLLADVVVAVGIAERLRRGGFFRGWGPPARRLGRDIAAYGLRGQIGGLLTLLNLRLDVALLGAIAGPAVLGIYSIASKYAELLRLPGLALTYVLYPSFAGAGRQKARQRTKTMIPAAIVVNVLAAAPLALAAGWVFPMLYGTAFAGALVPAWILIGGLIGESVCGLVTAYLYGVRRPGLNSLAIGVGVVATVLGDLLLIPRYGAVGAAVASAVAYVVTAGVLLACFAGVRPPEDAPGAEGDPT